MLVELIETENEVIERHFRQKEGRSKRNIFDTEKICFNLTAPSYKNTFIGSKMNQCEFFVIIKG